MALIGTRASRPPSWICDACREARHDECVGPSSCFCQHRTVRPTEPVTGSPGE